MKWDLYSTPKYSLGDLVRVTEKVDFLMYGHTVKPGAIGIIVFIDEPDLEQLTVWGVDYGVLIGDKVRLFFETEIELFDFSKFIKSTKPHSKD